MQRTARLKRIRLLPQLGSCVTAALPPFKREGKGSTRAPTESWSGPTGA